MSQLCHNRQGAKGNNLSELTGKVMQTFYPEIKPYQRHEIAVEPPHQLYIDESGNPDGIPVLFVHGGPGAGCSKFDRRFFDPELYRIILFDQRGSGRSQPHAELQGNTTQQLVADMEVIRQFLGFNAQSGICPNLSRASSGINSARDISVSAARPSLVLSRRR